MDTRNNMKQQVLLSLSLSYLFERGRPRHSNAVVQFFWPTGDDFDRFWLFLFAI